MVDTHSPDIFRPVVTKEREKWNQKVDAKQWKNEKKMKQ